MTAIPTTSVYDEARRPALSGFGARVDRMAVPVPAYAVVDRSFYRGLFFAVLFVTPLWALSGIAFWWLMS